MERYRIVPAQFDRPPGKPSTLGRLPRDIGHPAIELAPVMTPRRHCVGGREIGVELYCLGEQRQRLFDGLPVSPMQIGHSAQIIVVRVEASGRLALGTFDLRPLHLRRNRSDDTRGDLILQLENVVEGAFETLGPRCARSSASMSCPVMRTRFAALRTLPSST